jgi:hypothetical protein
LKESKLQAKIKKYLKEIGAFVVNTTVVYPAGCPDLLVCYQGKFIGIEVKTGTNESDLQKYQRDKINKCGGLSIVARSVEDIKKYL